MTYFSIFPLCVCFQLQTEVHCDRFTPPSYERGSLTCSDCNKKHSQFQRAYSVHGNFYSISHGKVGQEISIVVTNGETRTTVIFRGSRQDARTGVWKRTCPGKPGRMVTLNWSYWLTYVLTRLFTYLRLSWWVAGESLRGSIHQSYGHVLNTLTHWMLKQPLRRNYCNDRLIVWWPNGGASFRICVAGWSLGWNCLEMFLRSSRILYRKFHCFQNFVTNVTEISF